MHAQIPILVAPTDGKDESCKKYGKSQFPYDIPWHNLAIITQT